MSGVVRRSPRDLARMSWHARRKYDEAVRRQIEERARRIHDLDLNLEAIVAARAVELLAFLPADPAAAYRRRLVDREIAAASLSYRPAETDESFRRRVLEAELAADTAGRRPARHNYPTTRRSSHA